MFSIVVTLEVLKLVTSRAAKAWQLKNIARMLVAAEVLKEERLREVRASHS